MKRILISLFVAWLSTLISVPDYAQEIHIGMPLSKLLPILAKQKCIVDTVREGRIKSFITSLEAYPFRRFTVDGRARFCIDPEPDTLEGWGWIADSMAFTDYKIIILELSKVYGDTGEEWSPTDLTQASHVWGPLIGRTTVDYLRSNHIYVSEGRNCIPDYDPYPEVSFPPMVPPPPPPPDVKD